ncbi:MAG: NAD(P)H-dependent glycerol-3-phosphate dehydrogenase [Bacteroidetes bacterium]|nr:NAD(P)H-dependent glycerol-3-phosphate dehydrogenase [Bacteroidota bacterium]
MNIGVLGGGSWATAIIKILSDNERSKKVNWWIRKEQTVSYIISHKHNPHYISSVYIETQNILPTVNIENVVKSSDILFVVIPSAFVYNELKKIKTSAFRNKIIVSAIKGLIPETGQIAGEYFENNLKVDKSKIGVITGPCHAEEVALEKLSYLTAASENPEVSAIINSIFSNQYIKINVSDDIYGTEYSAVLKNIYAIACGICHGLGCGDNFQAVLISNAIREIKKFIDVIHPISRDINDSAYLGDLLVTAYSQFSRNRTFGNMLGKGYSVKSAQIEMNMIAEGYYAAKSIYKLNQKYKVKMPILDFTYKIIYENLLPPMAFEELIKKID